MPIDPNSTDVKAVEKAMVRVLRDNLYGGEELVLIEPFNGPRPKVSYAAVMMVSTRPEQHEVFDYEDNGDGGLTEYLRGERYCKMRIQFFNTGARQKAVDCQNLLRSSNRNFDLTPITGFGEIGEYQDVTTEYLGKLEERTVLDVWLYANMSAAYEIGKVTKVKGDILLDGERVVEYAVDGENYRR